MTQKFTGKLGDYAENNKIRRRLYNNTENDTQAGKNMQTRKYIKQNEMQA